MLVINNMILIASYILVLYYLYKLIKKDIKIFLKNSLKT